MKIFLLILFNFLIVLLNIPLDTDSLSPIGLVVFTGGYLFPIIWFATLFTQFFSKNKNYPLIIAYAISIIFFCVSIYWDILAFDAIDFSSFKNVSIWYRIGHSLSFTFGVLLSLNTYFILKKFKRQELPTLKTR